MSKPTLTNRVGDLEVHVGEVTARVENLEGWQKAQNGTARDTRELVLKVLWLNIAQITAVVSIAYWFGTKLR